MGALDRVRTIKDPLTGNVIGANFISTDNARSASELAPFAVYQGTGEDVSRFSRAGISISSSNPTDGQLCIEVSHDNVNWGGPERAWANTQTGQPHMWNIVEKYFRIKYTNGTTKANDLSIQVQYSTNSGILLGHQIDETVIDETEAIMSKTVLVGRNEKGEYSNVPTTLDGKLKIQQDENETTRVLKDLLVELKIANQYNAIMHGFEIEKE